MAMVFVLVLDCNFEEVSKWHPCTRLGSAVNAVGE